MIIDMHTHTFPEKIAASTLDKLKHLGGTEPFTDGTAAGLGRSMAAAGVERSVVLPVATSAHQVPHINDSSARICEKTEETGILSLGCMHPDFADYKGELRRVKALGLRGIKLHPPYQQVEFDDVRYLRILEEAFSLDLTVVTHAGIDIGIPGLWCTPDHVLRVLAQVGPGKLVLAHMGGWKLWDEVEEKLSGAPVYFDTAFTLGAVRPLPGREQVELMGAERFVRLARRHGTHRILFGTDSPWGGQREGVAEVEKLPLKREEKDAILGDNARRLLGL